jgi:hypothetical protein
MERSYLAPVVRQNVVAVLENRLIATAWLTPMGPTERSPPASALMPYCEMHDTTPHVHGAPSIKQPAL